MKHCLKKFLDKNAKCLLNNYLQEETACVLKKMYQNTYTFYTSINLCI